MSIIYPYMKNIDSEDHTYLGITHKAGQYINTIENYLDISNLMDDLNNGLLIFASANDGSGDITLLDYNKKIKRMSVDMRTQELIKMGFTFDGVLFSLSENAQRNWLGLKVKEASLSWPVELTSDDDDSYSLAQSDLDAFTDAAIGIVQYHIDTGRALKISIKNAVNQAALDAIVDNR